MDIIQLTLTAESPLAVGRQKPGGSVSEAQDYIPGTVIRGAIAGLILSQTQSKANTPLDGDFAALFTDAQPAIFTNAYPGIQSKVLPATALSSKNDPGFSNSDTSKTGIFDTLIDRFCSHKLGIPFDPTEPDGSGGRVEPYGGLYQQEKSHYETASTAKRLLTRVGINRRRATAADQILYSLEVMNEGGSKKDSKKGKDIQPATFTANIYIRDPKLAATLTTYITANAHLLRLGGSVSRGLGRVKIEAKHQPSPKSLLAQRVEAFNQKLRDRWNQWHIFGDPKDPLPNERQYFSVGLQAGAIFKDNWQRTTVPSSGMLQEEANLLDDSLHLEIAFSSYGYTSGWNAAWGLFKDVELITNQGSIFLFSTTQINTWIPLLAELEQRGIGERTSEGFGQVEVCSQFHHHFWEKPL
ncbi:MAG: CRISPR-associated RAMP protein Csx10 [Synechococcaceae cyanobacterium SM2_3_2]|nr:CRISPR-associated RAMP protein Csx10 [Synechococcaceae cyanobacterium SM2_3_2]